MATKTETTPRALQLTFVLVLFAAYMLQATITLSNIFSFPAQPGQDLTPFYLNLGQMIGVPVLLAVAAWLISPRKISRLGKAFESGVLSVIGFSLVTITTTTASILPVDYSTTYTYPLAPLVMPIIVTAGYVVALLALRASKRWK